MNQYKKIKKEEEILNRNIKSRATDLLKNQAISKNFKDLKAGLTLNSNDLDKLNLKDLWKISFKEEKLMKIS